MGRIKSAVIVTLCFVLLGFVVTNIFAEEIKLPIAGGVYHMISSPVLPEDPDPQVSLVDDLGSYDKTQWRFFRWDPVDSKYIELKTSDWNPTQHDFDFGRGYWIISKNPKEVDIQGNPTLNDQIELKGQLDDTLWNQIGSIFLQDFTIGIYPNCNLWVTPKSGGASFQLNDPLNPYTHVTLQEYAGGSSYTDIGDEPGEVLETGKAYWLKNIYDEDVILSFDPAGLISISTTEFTNLPSQDFFARVAQQDDPPDPPPGIKGVSFSSGSASGGCFIATAAYRDYDHPNVQILRGFRDRYLLTNSLGRMLVGFYYQYSPALARFAGKHQSIKALTRFNLVPLIGMSTIVSKMNVYAYFAIMASPLLGGFFFLRRRQRVLGRWKVKHSSKSKEGKRKR